MFFNKKIITSIFLSINFTILFADESLPKQAPAQTEIDHKIKKYKFPNFSISLPSEFIEAPEDIERVFNKALCRDGRLNLYIYDAIKPFSKVWILGENEENAAFCILTKMRNADSDPLGLGSLFREICADLQTCKTAKNIEKGEKTIKGKNSKWLLVQYKAPPNTDISIKNLTFLFSKNKDFYFVEFRTNEKNFSKYESTFHTIVESFEMH